MATTTIITETKTASPVPAAGIRTKTTEEVIIREAITKEAIIPITTEEAITIAPLREEIAPAATIRGKAIAPITSGGRSLPTI
jgi:hypothetical protein